MISFIYENAGTLCVAAVLAVIVGLVIAKMIRDRKNGHGSCGCGCSSCAANGACHSGCKSTKK
ncbi:MAG: FeoB-associated Cys-rich membrane protein [Oscillospiraceae bacterium]|nr:FeoB-associated Cys-rich membrane protein [Oscillospiraceae bacterium]